MRERFKTLRWIIAGLFAPDLLEYVQELQGEVKELRIAAIDQWIADINARTAALLEQTSNPLDKTTEECNTTGVVQPTTHKEV